MSSLSVYRNHKYFFGFQRQEPAAKGSSVDWCHLHACDGCYLHGVSHSGSDADEDEEEGKDEFADATPCRSAQRQLSHLYFGATVPVPLCMKESRLSLTIVKAHDGHRMIGVDLVEELDINWWSHECYIYLCHN
jgi:hypothetical protein